MPPRASHDSGVAPATWASVRSRAARVGRYWLPVLAWAAAIFVGSGDVLSSSNTSLFLEPLIRWVLPKMPEATLGTIMAVIRKGGHLTEYAILAALCWRALRKPMRGDARPWSWTDASLALTLAAIYAASDELHQMFVPSRTASAWDVLLDACGAAVGLAIIWNLRRTAEAK